MPDERQGTMSQEQANAIVTLNQLRNLAPEQKPLTRDVQPMLPDVLDGLVLSKEKLKAANATALTIPRQVITVAELPLLGSGKTDYQSLNRMAKEQVKP